MALPAINQIPSLPPQERAQILDLLFEPCAELHLLAEKLLVDNEFTNYHELISCVEAQLLQLADSHSKDELALLDRILRAHPRLGEKKVDSEQSRAEQAALRGGDGEDVKRLADLNEEYERAFPGLKYVVFVAGRSRAEIFTDMQRRIARNDINLERLEATKAMSVIADDRARKLLAAAC